MNHENERFIRQCLLLAESAVKRGDHPFGALLVNDGEVVLTALNTVNTERDLTGHAEMNLVRRASKDLPVGVVRESVLYTSTEPCPMCAGGIYWVGISTVVFGCPAEALGRIVGPSLLVSCRDIFAQGARHIEVIGPILEEEAIQIHERFWESSGT